MAKKSPDVKDAAYQRDYYLRVTKPKRKTVTRMRNGICAYCGHKGAIGDDHRTATRNGGTDEPDNLTDCCTPCNRSKGPRDLEDWRETIGRWHVGMPYFSPDHIEFAMKSGLDLKKIARAAAAKVRFKFEGGDGKIVHSFVQRRLTKRA